MKTDSSSVHLSGNVVLLETDFGEIMKALILRQVECVSESE